MVDRVGEWLVAADKYRRDAEIDVVEQRLGDGFGRADQRGGIAGCAGRRRQRRPQGAVVALAGSGRRQQPLRTGILGSPIRAIADVARRELTPPAPAVCLSPPPYPLAPPPPHPLPPPP